MIKDGAEGLAVPLTYLINSCLEQSVFPDTEKYAKIIPVYKSVLYGQLHIHIDTACSIESF